MNKFLTKKRIIISIGLVIVFVLGMLMKLYMSRYSPVWPDKTAGTFYIIFWSFFIALIVPGRTKLKLVLGVLIITCLLEFTQIYSFPLLEAIRSTFVGRAMIGNSFSWTDFPWYLVGALLAFIMLRLLDKAYPGK